MLNTDELMKALGYTVENREDIEMNEKELNNAYRYGEHEKTVNHPKHYSSSKIEAIDVIEDWGLNFSEGNVIKYIARAREKGIYEENIKKCIWYLERLIK